MLVDGQPVGTTTATTLTPAPPLADGLHRWQVVATDPRGQSVRSTTRNLRIDATPPGLTVKITGRRQPGRTLKFVLHAIDLRPPAGSGVKQMRVDFADGTIPAVVKTDRFTFSHAFRNGTFKVRISATDAAGNATVVFRTVVVKKPKKSKGKSKKKTSQGGAGAP